MPHQIQLQIIKRRLAGKEGAEKSRELRAILTDLPVYESGPYADLRRWVSDQIEESRARSRVVHRDSIAVRREGAAQIALVGPPNAGKSSLLQSLSHVQIKVGDYAFTTVRPVPALTRIHGVLIQLVEIPGLLPGAGADANGRRALLSVIRAADALAYCHDLGEPVESLRQIRAEIADASIDLPEIVAATKMDEAPEGSLERLADSLPGMTVVGVSIIVDDSLEALKDAIWQMTGLIAVYLRHNGRVDETPLALETGATVADVAACIHKGLGAVCRAAHVWGPSARFEGQQVGRNHVVMDGDTVEIVEGLKP